MQKSWYSVNSLGACKGLMILLKASNFLCQTKCFTYFLKVSSTFVVSTVEMNAIHRCVCLYVSTQELVEVVE